MEGAFFLFNPVHHITSTHTQNHHQLLRTVRPPVNSLYARLPDYQAWLCCLSKFFTRMFLTGCHGHQGSKCSHPGIIISFLTRKQVKPHNQLTAADAETRRMEPIQSFFLPSFFSFSFIEVIVELQNQIFQPLESDTQHSTAAKTPSTPSQKGHRVQLSKFTIEKACHNVSV